MGYHENRTELEQLEVLAQARRRRNRNLAELEARQAQGRRDCLVAMLGAVERESRVMDVDERAKNW